jgi:hypothetical protein
MISPGNCWLAIPGSRTLRPVEHCRCGRTDSSMQRFAVRWDSLAMNMQGTLMLPGCTALRDRASRLERYDRPATCRRLPPVQVELT